MTRESYDLPKNFAVIDDCICAQVVTSIDDDSEVELFTEDDIYFCDWIYGKLLQ